MSSDQKAVSGCGTNCPVCHGTGWELIVKAVEGDPAHTFARPCQKCRGVRRSQENTNVPLQFCEADMHKFGFDSYSRNIEKLKKLVWNFFEKYADWETAGKGLYFWSRTPGSGKTFLSCCIGRSVMMKHDLRMRFTTCPDYIATVGDSYKRMAGTEDLSERYRLCDLLILDDIGAQKTGDWQEQEIFRIVNERLNNRRITIFTSNMPPEKLNVGSRTIDRIRKMSVVVQMPEESIRLKKAQDEQDAFLRKVFSE